ncbi:flavoprotein [Allostreptomyces psammosilenae]|uniref:Flavoprotein domain-containing protein n=1 Tax=Allostreptomyces psammosilenae TaxID=1892865 RepID=A0A852ZVI8_9ACTN|nr:flavoprotein [Allostreptomyces psammosilenae]NYI05657.1 hypothetical protein [Allostreptomyces psammosilenae]
MSRVLYLIACAAGPTRQVGDGVRAAQARGWDTCLVLSPSAARWHAGHIQELEELTGHPVRWEYKLPSQPDVLPKADAILVSPLSATSLNKWGAGIADTLAIGIPLEAVHLGVPVVVQPFFSTLLAAHPAVPRSVATLEEQGVRVVWAPGEPHPTKQALPWPWELGLDALGM